MSLLELFVSNLIPVPKRKEEVVLYKLDLMGVSCLVAMV